MAGSYCPLYSSCSSSPTSFSRKLTTILWSEFKRKPALICNDNIIRHYIKQVQRGTKILTRTYQKTMDKHGSTFHIDFQVVQNKCSK